MTPLALSTSTIAVLVVLAALDLFAIIFGLTFVRARKAQRAEAARVPGLPEPPKPARAVSRRDFFRRSLLVSLATFAAEFGFASVAFLWPTLKSGFGSVVPAGALEDIVGQIRSSGEPFYVGAGRFYIVRYEGRATSDVDYEAEGVAAEGIMPLYQRCVHLGCRVPFCVNSKWFECPCHGSKYNGAGEYKLGPAPRGMDRFQVTIEAGQVMVDTSEVILGPPRGAETVKQPPQGPFCV
jgi:cytochrome b6-f complex iron-sulfur subunit